MGATHTNETQATEREDFLSMASEQHTNFLCTVTDINEQQAAARTTVSELAPGGLVKNLRCPWSPPEPINWTVRHILLHIFRETSHHGGHANTMGEALDGSNTTARMTEATSPGKEAGGAAD